VAEPAPALDPAAVAPTVATPVEMPAELVAASDATTPGTGHRALSPSAALLVGLMAAALIGGWWLVTYRTRLRSGPLVG